VGTISPNYRTYLIDANPAQVSLLTLNPASVYAGYSSTGTVSVNQIAPPNGTVVSLTSSATGVAQAPGSVTIPAGQKSAQFTITTNASLAADSTADITATGGGSKQSARLTVYSVHLASLALSPDTVNGGSSSIGTVKLDGPAPP